MATMPSYNYFVTCTKPLLIYFNFIYISTNQPWELFITVDDRRKFICNIKPFGELSIAWETPVYIYIHTGRATMDIVILISACRTSVLQAKDPNKFNQSQNKKVTSFVLDKILLLPPSQNNLLWTFNPKFSVFFLKRAN